MICYKVVGKKLRFGSNYTMLYKDCDLQSTAANDKSFKRFFPQYKKGKIIKSVRDSQGIFCFETLSDAYLFRGNCSDDFIELTTIIKVEGIGKPNFYPKVIKECGAWVSNLLSYKIIAGMVEGIGEPNRSPGIIQNCGMWLLDYKDKKLFVKAPKGSITFKSVRVLE